MQKKWLKWLTGLKWAAAKNYYVALQLSKFVYCAYHIDAIPLKIVIQLISYF